MTGAPRFVSPQQLLDLVADTLDPGYAAAAARRGPQPATRWYDRPAVGIGCLLIGFVLVVAYVHTHRGAPEAAKLRDSLVARVRTAEATTDRLTGQLDADEARLSRLRKAVLPSDLERRLTADQLAAGTVAATGPGLTVTLDEPSSRSAPPARGGTVPITATNILTDRDIRSVVNQLWAEGAEAIAVNDVRLTPTSAIRFAGEAVLIDFRHITPPYVIAAVGNADDLATGFAASAVASRYQTLKGVDGIGFSFGESSRLTLPAAPPLSPRYAKAGR
ncbi:MAG: DUF881 domain-containing protein [Jatrophihabitans sp.]|uniref:DUF881 domain-containing protein n=1 Tax=Jatrophihabitans sp. TaxID=1932789 RepID=UPI003F81EF2F